MKVGELKPLMEYIGRREHDHLNFDHDSKYYNQLTIEIVSRISHLEPGETKRLMKLLHGTSTGLGIVMERILE